MKLLEINEKNIFLSDRTAAYSKKCCIRIRVERARCSSVVRAISHSAVGRWIDPSWWTQLAISRSSQCTTTDVTKAVVCVILPVGFCI